MRRLRSKEMKGCKRFTDSDHEFRRQALQAFVDGVIPENTTRRIKNRLQNEADPLQALQILRDQIPESVLEAQQKRRSQRQDQPREVILSASLQAK